MVLDKIKLENIVNRIKAMSLDDILETDFIAESIYDRFITLYGIRNETDRNELLCDVLRTAKVIIAHAYFDKHPEIEFESKYLGLAFDVFDDDESVVDTMMAAYTMVMMCPKTPKNLDRFAKLTWLYLRNEKLKDPSYIETFKTLRQEVKDEGYCYLVEDFLPLDSSASDLTKIDWKSVTKGYNTDLIEQIVNEGDKASRQLEILSAIEARYKLDEIKTNKSGLLSPFDVTNNFIKGLRDVVLVRMEQENAAIASRIQASDNATTATVKKLQSENERLQAEIEAKDEDVSKAIAEGKALQRQYEALQQEADAYKVKISELQELLDKEDKDSNNNTFKCKDLLLLSILGKLNKGIGVNDKTKIAKLAQYLIGGSYGKHYNYIQEGIQLTNYHDDEIKRVNEIMTDMGIDITLTKG